MHPAEREPLYRAGSDVVIDIDTSGKTPDGLAEFISNIMMK